MHPAWDAPFDLSNSNVPECRRRSLRGRKDIHVDEHHDGPVVGRLSAEKVTTGINELKRESESWHYDGDLPKPLNGRLSADGPRAFQSSAEWRSISASTLMGTGSPSTRRNLYRSGMPAPSR
jgi:hypothetical protein